MAFNDTFLKALLRQPTEYTPSWLMRQAGRYLPEYNATRKRAGSFLNLCHSPEMACEVTLQPLDRYPLDAAILFSDILTVPDAMGLELYFVEGEGPKFKKTVRDEAAVNALYVPDPNVGLRYVMDAVRTIKNETKDRVPLIGFSGSPWTLACYMVEGGGSDDHRTTRSMMYERPDLMHKILCTLSDSVGSYLAAQIEAGADAVMVFDTWGGLLPQSKFWDFSGQYIQRALGKVPKSRDGSGLYGKIPQIVFVKGGGVWLEQIANTGCDAMGIDWTVSLGDAKRRVGEQCAIQGNLDPMALFGDDGQIRSEVEKTFATLGNQSNYDGHVFNLGHGISQFTRPEAVTSLLRSVREVSARSIKNRVIAP